MVTDRPQFDVLANMRPAPERKPSEVEALREQIAQERHLSIVAWGIIANVSGGDWSQQSEEWRKAAEKWRDDWIGDKNVPQVPRG